jgi:hypothetical protein
MRALREPWRIATLLAGTLVLVGSGKGEFVLGIMLGLIALGIAATGADRGRLTGALLAAIAAVGLALHVSAFGGLGGAPARANWPLLLSMLAAALLVPGPDQRSPRTRALGALGLAMLALALACGLRGAAMVPTEFAGVVHEAPDASLAALLVFAIRAGGAQGPIALAYAGALVVPCLVALAAVAEDGAGVLAYMCVLATWAPACTCWLAATIPGSTHAAHQVVRLRIALVVLGMLSWLAVGVRAVTMPASEPVADAARAEG